MNTKIQSDNNKQSKAYGMTLAPNNALELHGSPAA